MNKAELKETIQSCLNDVVFTYNKKQSGITSEVHNYVPTYQAWHGSDVKEYAEIDELMTDPFFSGKSLVDLVDTVEFTIA